MAYHYEMNEEQEEQVITDFLDVFNPGKNKRLNKTSFSERKAL